MNILLINPPAIDGIVADMSDYFDKSSGAYPPMGLMYLASFLNKFEGHNIRILDANMLGMNYGISDIKFNDYWKEFARRPSRRFVTPVWQEFCSKEELAGFLRKAYRTFYFSIKKLFRTVSLIYTDLNNVQEPHINCNTMLQ